MGLFSSNEPRAVSRYELRTYARRIKELNMKVNGGSEAAKELDPSAMYAVTPDMLANKSPYEKDEIRLAMALREFRDTLQREAELGKGKSSDQLYRDPELTRVRQSLRKQEMVLKDLQKALMQSAVADRERQRAQEALHHLGAMRRRYDESKHQLARAAFSTDDGAMERAAALVATPDRGTTNSRLVVRDLEDVGAYQGRSLREDDEFNMFFSQLAANDQAMDAALDRISQGVAVLREHALQFNQELKVQNQLLDETTAKVEKTTAKLDTVNRRLSKTIKDVQSDRLCIYVICFVLLLGLIGFILYETGVVKK